MLFFGIGQKHSMRLEKIGDKFNLTRERVRQIKEIVINKMKGKRKKVTKNVFMIKKIVLSDKKYLSSKICFLTVVKYYKKQHIMIDKIE